MTENFFVWLGEKRILRSTNLAFPILLTIGGLATAFALYMGYGWQWWLLAVLGYFLYGCCGITVTFHRLLAHRSYQTPKLIEYLFSFFGQMGGTGSGIGWVMIHRIHHNHADKDGDPHSPNLQTLKEVLINSYGNVKFDKFIVRDILTDPVHKAMHDYYFAFMAGWWLLLYAIDPRVMLFVGLIGMLFNMVASVTSVFLDHKYGYRTFETDDESRNNWFNSLYAWGEGWHNNHHWHPGRWYFGINWKEIDIGGLVVALIKTGSKQPMFPVKKA